MNLKEKIINILLVLLLCSCTPAKDKIVYVRDGDTVVASSGEVIRLFDVDCPESAQQYGQEAKLITQKYLLLQEVYIQRMGLDKYGRTLAYLRMKPDGSTFNELLLLRGAAWTSGIYCHDPQFTADMEQAKQNKEGLWAYPNPIPPYIFRRQNKHK